MRRQEGMLVPGEGKEKEEKIWWEKVCTGLGCVKI